MFLGFLKKKNKKDNSTSFSEMKQNIINKAKNRAELNLLSPAQIHELIENNTDVDFLEKEMKEMMNNPDIDFLTEKLMPTNLKPNNQRKEINSVDIVKSVCLADIIGSRYEFIEHDYSSAITEMLITRKSTYTDDTVLSIATMKAILKNPENPDFRSKYISAYKEHPMAGYGSSFIGWVLDENDIQKGYNSMGNGCAMRISFIPAHYDDIKDVIKYTIQSAMVTHNHIESIKASVVLSVCIWMALHNYGKEEIYFYATSHYTYTKEEKEMLLYGWSQYNIPTDLNTISNEKSKASLYANYAVPFAIQCFCETNSYEECMREILSHFGDTDTVCAIAGGLCYAFYGETGLNVDEILKEKGVEL